MPVLLTEYCKSKVCQELMYMQHRHMVCGKLHICHDLDLDQNVNGICAILRIPCACVACISMLDKPWISSIQSTKQARYQPVNNCTYWPVMSPYNIWNIINLKPKSIPVEAFDEIHQLVLDGISENMASLFQ